MGGALRRFDRVPPIPHPTNDVPWARRLASIAAILTLCVGNSAICAGWQATPEARMACCMNGTSCPMHTSESHDSSSNHAMSQTQADTCCAAASNRRDPSSPSATFALSNAAALPSLLPFVVPVMVPALQDWRALIPLPVSPVPKHLVLSVFLV